MKNEKYKYLKNYIAEQKLICVDDAWNNLSWFYEDLPERARNTKERKTSYAFVIQSFQEAFESIIETIANCPFLKIEISNQIEQQKAIEELQEMRNTQLFMTGWTQENGYQIEKKILDLKNSISKLPDMYIQPRNKGGSENGRENK